MRSVYLSILIFSSSLHCFGQSERAAFTETGRGAVTAFATDYQALGINPANLAFGNEFDKRISLGLGAVSFSLYAEGFVKSDLIKSITSVDNTLTEAEQFKAAEAFANTNLSLDFTASIFGFALNTKGAGNFAFGMNLQGSQFARFNLNGSEQLWRGFVDPYFDQWVVEGANGIRDTIANQGPNSEQINNVIAGISSNPVLGSDLYDGTTVQALSYLEYSFGYGKTFYETDKFSLAGGLGLKYLQGLYLLNVQISDGEVENAYTASSPLLAIDYGTSEESNPSFVDLNGKKTVGSGFGFDFGVAAEVGNNIRISAAVTDIGSIRFDGNVYQSKDTLVYDLQTTGIDSYNIFKEFDAFAGRDGIFNWSGRDERKVNLPTQGRLGLAYFYKENIRLGVDVLLPLNDAAGNLDKALFAAGADFIPIQAIKISAGFGSGGNYGFRIPFGLTFRIAEGAWEFGAASRDILYFVKGDSPNLTFATGFLRFRFGAMLGVSQSRMYQ